MMKKKSVFRIIYCFAIVYVLFPVSVSILLAQSEESLNQLIQNEHWERAYSMAKQLIDKDPSNVQYLYQFGLVCNKLKKYQEAVQPLRQVMHYQSNFPDGYSQLAFAYRNLNNDEQALKILERGLDLFPNNHIMMYQLATVYLKVGRYQKALKYFELYRDIAPYNQNDATFMIALCYKEMKQIDKAKELLQQVIALNPVYSQAYFEMGMIYMEQQKFDNAIYYFKQTVTHDPRNVQAWFYLSNLYSSQEKWQEAREACYAILDINPDNPEIYLNLAQIFISTERPMEAIFTLNDALNRFEPNEDIYLNLGVAYGLQEQYADECNAYLKAIEINPHFAPAYYNLGIAYRKQEQWDNSIEQFQKMLSSFPDDPDILSQMVETYLASGQLDKAEELLPRIENRNSETAQQLREKIDSMR